MGNCLLMGRKTFESIPKPLPGRTSIVLTRNASYKIEHPSVRIVRSIDEAIQIVPASQKLFVVGGATIYEQTFVLADSLLKTNVLADVDGDTRLPDWDLSAWQMEETEYLPAGEYDQFATRFEQWTRLPTNQHT